MSYSKSEINEQLLYQWRDILFTVDELRERLEKEEEFEKTITQTLYALKSSFITQDSKFKLVNQIDKFLVSSFKLWSSTTKIEILDIFNHILNNPIYNYPINMGKVINLINKIKKSDDSDEIKHKAKTVLKSFEETKVSYLEIKKKKELAVNKIENFEINIRNFIKKSLVQYYGEEDWWEKGISEKFRNIAMIRLTQKRNEDPELELHKIQFLVFQNYIDIISSKSNWEPIFSRIFKDKGNIQFPFKKLNKFRNDLFHSHLNTKDLNNYETYVNEIIKFIP